jgi:cell division protein FtsB
MARRHLPTPTDDALDETDPTPSAGAHVATPGEPDLATLSIAGITRRRMAVFVGVLLAAWIVIVFARQVSDASAATSKAEAMVATNEAKQRDITALEGELLQIRQRQFVLQQARGYGLGGPHEIPFTLAPGAPPLPADAPGSGASRLGTPASVSPLERWLTLLFGPGR